MTRFVVWFMGVLMLACVCVIWLALEAGHILPDDEILVSASLDSRVFNLEIYRIDITHQLIYQLTHAPDADFEPIWSPNAQQIAFGSSREHGLNYHIYLMDTKGNDVRRLSNYPETERKPIWSPAGQYIVYQREIRDATQLMLIDLKSGKAHRVTNYNDSEADATWSPDGRYLTYLANKPPIGDPQILSFDFHTGNTYIVQKQSDWWAEPIWSPDGRYILYSTPLLTARNIYLWDVAREQSILLYTANYIVNSPGLDWSPDGRFIIYVAATDYGKGPNVYSNGYSGIFQLDVAACLQQSDTCKPQLLTHIPGFYQNPRWRPHTS